MSEFFDWLFSSPAGIAAVVFGLMLIFFLFAFLSERKTRRLYPDQQRRGTKAKAKANAKTKKDIENKKDEIVDKLWQADDEDDDVSDVKGLDLSGFFESIWGDEETGKKGLVESLWDTDEDETDDEKDKKTKKPAKREGDLEDDDSEDEGSEDDENAVDKDEAEQDEDAAEQDDDETERDDNEKKSQKKI